MDTKARILVTGGTGSIGQHVVAMLLRPDVQQRLPSNIIVLSRNDSAQFLMATKYRDVLNTQLRFINGDIRDHNLINSVAGASDIVIHCAALKHVFNDRYNTAEYTDVNVRGTYNILHALRNSSDKTLVFLSTDKAVYPTTVMGATKMLAENVLVGGSWAACRRVIVRFGNVLGTRGAVLHSWQDQAAHTGCIEITPSPIRRYYLLPEQAAAMLIEPLLCGSDGCELFIPWMSWFNLKDLAQAFVEYWQTTKHADCAYRYEPTLKYDQEKEHEELLADHEMMHVSNVRRIATIEPQPVYATFRLSQPPKETIDCADRLAKGFTSYYDPDYQAAPKTLLADIKRVLA